MNPLKQLLAPAATAALVAATVLATAACGNGQASVAATGPTAVATQAAVAATAQPAATATATATPAPHYVGKFALSPARGAIGSDVKAAGTGFTPNSDLTVAWQDVHGTWNTGATDGTFNGRAFKTTYVPLSKVHTDASGAFTTSFTVPNGFGYTHDVVVQQDGAIRNKAGYRVDMDVTISPTSGPVGTPITITVTGMGYLYLENSWQLNYDDKYTGWLSSVTTYGTATAVIPATGVPGTHVLQVLHGWSHVAYLNNQQSPRPDREMFTLHFTITPGDAVMPAAATQQTLALVKDATPPDSGQPQVWTNVASGPISTPLTVTGRNLPPGKTVQLSWFRVVGNRVSGNGWGEDSTVLGSPQVAPDGTFTFQFDALDDLGGPHRIEASIDGQTVAATQYTVEPSAYPIANASGPAGTIALVHLKGVGWTETANIYTMDYDNTYMGFACGFNSQGDVQIYVPLSGAPGWHYIDLYPAIYKGSDMRGADDFRIPQLTFAQDHPREQLPAFHFAVYVTGGSSQ